MRRTPGRGVSRARALTYTVARSNGEFSLAILTFDQWSRYGFVHAFS